MRCKKSKAHAFMLMDLLVSLGMAIALLMAMTMAVGRLQRSQRQLAEDRTAMRQLESQLLSLQAKLPPSDPDIITERLPDASPVGTSWVKLTLKQKPAQALVGLIPSQPLPASSPASARGAP